MAAASRKRPRASVREDDLTVLHTPSTGSVTADLIFVHGLQGHPKGTWQFPGDDTAYKRSLFERFCRKSNRENCEQDSDSTFWPEDLLSTDFPKIRILTYGYDSHVTHYFKGPANKLNLSQLGEALLNRVAGERKRSKCIGRPIIFVAHSLGGLLVKEAIIESKKQLYDASKTEVYNSTQAIIFFGTPHRGSDDAKWGLLCRSIVSAAFDTNDKLLRALEPDSEMLDKLARDFQDILDEGKLRICSFLESAGKIGLSVFNNKVVPDTSASFGSRKFEYRDYINKNHMNMCRFNTKTDGGYVRFTDGLAFCIRPIDTRADEDDAEESVIMEDRRQGLLNSLKFHDMSSREKQLVNANVNTVDWLWSMPSGNESLTDWLSTRGGIFWIQGKPGSGKSTLMNYLKNQSRTRYYLKKASNEAWVVIRFFFDFRARKGVPNNFEGLLKSFLFQLTLEITELAPAIEEAGKISEMPAWPECPEEVLCWDVKNLRRALNYGLKACRKNICMFIDGLDEFEGSGSEILDMISFFQSISSPEFHSRCVKICLASRPEPLIHEALSKSRGFRVQDYNDRGVQGHISLRLKTAAHCPESRAYTDPQLVQLTESIVKRAQGVFLWARFAIDELIEGIAEGDDVYQLQSRLNALPEDLEAIYARILNRILQKPERAQEAAVMLQVAYFTLRSLPIREFFIVFRLSMVKEVPEEASTDVATLAIFEKQIAARTGGLLEVGNGPDQVVKLIHETVRSYLDNLNPRSDPGSEDRRPNLSSITRHKGNLGECHTPNTLMPARNIKRRLNVKIVVLNVPLPVNIRSGECQPPPHGKGSGPINPETTLTRPIRACLRCRLLKCCHSTPCFACTKASSPTYPILCTRVRIEDCMLAYQWSSISFWRSFSVIDARATLPVRLGACDIKVEKIGLGQKYGFPLHLSVRGFLHENLDTNDSVQTAFPNAYGVENFDEASAALKRFVSENVSSYVRTIVNPSSKVAYIVFQKALEISESSTSLSLLKDALQLWTATRCIEDRWHFSTVSETAAVTDFEEILPVTPILHYQLESIIQTQILAPLQSSIQGGISKSVDRKQSVSQMTLLLTIFVLLHNFEMVLAHQRRLKREGKAQVQSCNVGIILSIETSATCLLAYFHCRFPSLSDLRHVSRKRGRLLRHLDDDMMRFIDRINIEISDDEKKMATYMKPGEYKGHSWFTGQMFVPVWQFPKSLVDEFMRPEIDTE